MPAMIAHPGMPVWQTLITRDLDQAKEFYGPLFGWEFRDEDPGYAVATKEGMPVAGIIANPDSPGTRWGLYFHAEDVEAAHEAALAVGGQSGLAPTPTDDGAVQSLLVDPTGAIASLRKGPDEQAIMAAGEPGTPVWFELAVTRNWDETLKFYHELCGFDVKLQGGGEGQRYATGDVEGSPVVGFWERVGNGHRQGEEVPGMWTISWGVSNLSEALEKVKNHGGLVLQVDNAGHEPAALIQDVAGAPLQLVEVPEFEPAEDDVHEPDLFA